MKYILKERYYNLYYWLLPLITLPKHLISVESKVKTRFVADGVTCNKHVTLGPCPCDPNYRWINDVVFDPNVFHLDHI